MPLSWLRPAAGWNVDGNELSIEAGGRTDWFVDPANGRATVNAPALVGPAPDGDFMLRARVRLDGTSTFDAGVLFVYAGDQTWAKLCLERSPQGPAMVVSVVTHGVSDDCNSQTVDGDETWLRIAKLGQAFAFHASADGERWDLVRHFALPAKRPSVGFEAQSPTGPGCFVTFGEIAYDATRLADLRDGS